MPLKKLGRPPYLLADEVEQDEVLEVIEKPWIVAAEKTKWNRERGKTVVKILRNGLIRTWSLNSTTWDRLVDAFGDDPGFWLGKKVQIKKETRTINNVDKVVLFGRAFKEPQQQLGSEPEPQPQPQPQAVDDAIMKQIKQLAPEEKQRLLYSLGGTPEES